MIDYCPSSMASLMFGTSTRPLRPLVKMPGDISDSPCTRCTEVAYEGETVSSGEYRAGLSDWNVASVIDLQLTNPTTLTSKNPGGPSAAMHECPFTAGMTNGVGKGMFSV